jgi:CheY-like chemotaxis protein
MRKLMIVSHDDAHREYLYSVLAGDDIRIIDSASGGEAMAVIKHEHVDGLVIDLTLRDIPAVDLVREIQGMGGRPAPPMVLYGPGPLSPQDAATLSMRSYTSSVRLTQTPERLLDETTLLLHRSEADMTERQRQVLSEIRRNDNALERRKVLVVDDDLRNIFALTSILEQHLLTVLHAENGRACIDVLMQTPDVDAVLMDIMMPEMDGYETTRAIRKIPQFRRLPIIALTAKAMKGDRDKCLEAGASDYVPKPVNLEQLFAVLRVWIARGHEAQDELIPFVVQ